MIGALFGIGGSSAKSNSYGLNHRSGETHGYTSGTSETSQQKNVVPYGNYGPNLEAAGDIALWHAQNPPEYVSQYVPPSAATQRGWAEQERAAGQLQDLYGAGANAYNIMTGGLDPSSSSYYMNDPGIQQAMAFIGSGGGGGGGGGASNYYSRGAGGSGVDSDFDLGRFDDKAVEAAIKKMEGMGDVLEAQYASGERQINENFLENVMPSLRRGALAAGNGSLGGSRRALTESLAASKWTQQLADFQATNAARLGDFGKAQSAEVSMAMERARIAAADAKARIKATAISADAAVSAANINANAAMHNAKLNAMTGLIGRAYGQASQNVGTGLGAIPQLGGLATASADIYGNIGASQEAYDRSYLEDQLAGNAYKWHLGMESLTPLADILNTGAPYAGSNTYTGQTLTGEEHTTSTGVETSLGRGRSSGFGWGLNVGPSKGEK